MEEYFRRKHIFTLISPTRALNCDFSLEQSVNLERGNIDGEVHMEGEGKIPLREMEDV